MHQSSFDFLIDAIDEIGSRRFVVDLGGRDVNGEIKRLLPDHYVSVDATPGKGVDVVADAATWSSPDGSPDLVLCLSVLEHTAKWREVVANAARILSQDGVLILTTTRDPWPVHSAFDGGPTLRPGEHYANLDPAQLEACVREVLPRAFVETGEDGTIKVLARKDGVAAKPKRSPRDPVTDLIHAFASVGVKVNRKQAGEAVRHARKHRTGCFGVNGAKVWIRTPPE